MIVVSWFSKYIITTIVKNLFLYYLVAFVIPVPVLVWIFKTQTGYLPTGLLFFYLIIYRGILDSYRLILKGVIARNDIWKMFVGGHVYWFKELYLKK